MQCKIYFRHLIIVNHPLNKNNMQTTNRIIRMCLLQLLMGTFSKRFIISHFDVEKNINTLMEIYQPINPLEYE